MSDDPKFDVALAFVLRHEGSGFSTNPGDPGGPTKYGISLRFLQQLQQHEHLDNLGIDLDLNADGDADENTILMLTELEASRIYHAAFWERYGYGRIDDPAVAAKVFDLAVNMGPHEAALVLQRALRSCFPPSFRLDEDGIIGPRTVDKTNLARPSQLRVALKSEAAGYYRWLAAIHADLFRFLDGWLNRAYDSVGDVA